MPNPRPTTAPPPHAPVRIAFVCTGNACRSQMAEGLARAKARPSVLIQSAGSHPAGYVHALAIDAMREIGIDISGHKSKWVEDLAPPPDVVVTVCDHARDSCPRLRGRLATLHWSMPDPVAIQDDRPAAMTLARKVRDDLAARIDALLAEVIPASEPPAEAGGLPDSEPPAEAGRLLDSEPPAEAGSRWRGTSKFAVNGSPAADANPPPKSRRPSRIRRWCLRLAAMVLSLMIATLVAELGFRLMAPQPTGFYAFDDFNRPDGSLRPGASGILCGVPVAINADAERGRTWPREKPAGALRVCVIGDSIVFGLGVTDDERYPVVAGRFLSERHPNRTIETIPLGQVAYRLSGYLTRLLPKALAYHPDVVVVGFVLNDFEPPPTSSAGPQITTITPTAQTGALAAVKAATGRLRKHSHLVYWLRKQAQVLLATRLMGHDELVRAWELECMYADSPQFQAMWDYTVRQLDEIHTRCAEAGAQLVILVTPFDNQMSAERLAYYRQYLPDLPDSCLNNIPQQRLAAYCAARSLPFVDITPAFKADADKVFMRMLEGRVDPCHPTAEGHRLIAQALAEKLEEMGGFGVDSQRRGR